MPKEDESLSRSDMMLLLAGEMLQLGPGRRLIAIDGVDGSGKSTFARDLIPALKGRPVVTVHVDDFLNAPEIRHRRGRDSAEGFWLDTYDYQALEENVLEPLSGSGHGLYTPKLSPEHSDRPERHLAPDNALILIEGMFLHRQEQANRWDYSIFLDVPFSETARRMSRRDGSNPDPRHPTMHRYVGGQRLYFENAQPWSRATKVVDNTLPDELRFILRHEAQQRQR